MTLLLMIAIVASACGARNTEPWPVAAAEATEQHPYDRPLLDTYWYLSRVMRAGGETVPLPPGTRPMPLRLAAEDGLTTANGVDGCNHFSRPVIVHAERLELGDGPTTRMACVGELPDTVGEVFRADEVGYHIEGDELDLISLQTGTVLTYEGGDGPFGPPWGLIVDQGGSSAEAYRLTWHDDGALELEMAPLGSGSGLPGAAGVGADPGRINAMAEVLDGRRYLFGIVPAAASRVVYEPAGGSSQELTLHDVDDPEHTVVGQFVDVGVDTWNLIAYDAAGEEIDRFVRG